MRPWRNREEFAKANISTMIEPNPWWGPTWYGSRAGQFDATGMLNTKGHSSFALELANCGQWIGIEDCGGLSATGLDGWVGTYILPEYQGKGYGTEAKQLMQCHLFENYHLEVVWADTASNHRNAIVSLERSGMKPAGRHYGISVSNGCYIDRLFFSVFRSDWETSKFRNRVIRG